MKWTNEQSDAIYKKGSNILVAAAAGSGKTAVLVERIIQKILTDKIDINKLLVVTFTNAAASEMRERVLEAIYKKLDEMPEDEHLKKQIILLGKSNICTIHSFCLEVIRNNFFKIGLSANFRISSEEEVEILKQEAIEDCLETYYESDSEEVKLLIDTYADYRSDDKLKEIILNVYKFIQSAPFPEEWLNKQVDMFKFETEEDFSCTEYGKVILSSLREQLEDFMRNLRKFKLKMEINPELDVWTKVIEDDIETLREIYEASTVSWDETFSRLVNLKFIDWPRKKCEIELKNEAKKYRDKVRKEIDEIVKKKINVNSAAGYDDLRKMYSVLDAIRNIVISFGKEFSKRKREKNIIDFNDIEHFALEILVDRNENGDKSPSDVAKVYMEKFEEIAIDEYQDSNEVQETILTSISRGNNIFMVGDVKQSIYKFRKACPKLFLEKYNSYSLGDSNDKGLKIQLFKNFRSRENVLDFTNMIFKNIMSEKLGEIDYTKDEYLNLGADYETIEHGVGNAEMYLIDTLKVKDEDDSDETLSQELAGSYEETSDLEETSGVDIFAEIDNFEKEEIEAKFVAKKIEELVNSKYKVKDKREGIRDIKYKDIVILLRATSSAAPVFEKELLRRNIPVFSDSANEYLDAIEIQTVINLLKVLDNPIDDIALVSVLRSKMFNFTDNEILEIRLVNREVGFYNTLLLAKDELNDNLELKEKLNTFLDKINEWQRKAKFMPLSELIWEIYEYTGFYHYSMLMPNGTLRAQNLKILFERAKEYEKTSFKGLYNFIKFLERIKNGSSDMASAKVIGENEDVVRIMSIHKSKGLEFPVVFLSCTAKKFNLMDLKDNILLHQELGIGPHVIEYKKKVKYPSLAKEAIKMISKVETISEEMRILYVALTRAKEKLIITGTKNDIPKYEEKLLESLNTYNITEDSEKIDHILLKKYDSYLDWMYLNILKNKSQDLIKLFKLKREEVLEGEESTDSSFENEELDFDKTLSDETINKIKERLTFNYKYEFLENVPSKTTVSKIKENENKNVEFEETKEVVGIANIVPSFINNEVGNVAAKKGTLMHLVLQKIKFDLNKEYTVNEINDLVNELVMKKIILDEDAKLVNAYKISMFTKSELYKKIAGAKVIEKEKAFCMKIGLDEYLKSDLENNDNVNVDISNESVLVQGIIDLYAVDNDDKIILVDYKTDYVEEGNENLLRERYNKQLELYKKCLEEGLDLEVKEIYIYSLYLNKEIKL